MDEPLKKSMRLEDFANPIPEQRITDEDLLIEEILNREGGGASLEQVLRELQEVDKMDGIDLKSKPSWMGFHDF